MPKGVYVRKPRERKAYDAALVAEVERLYATGMTQGEVGQAVGLSQKVIYTIMTRHGIKARVAAKRNQFGENNHRWKGDAASNQAFHRRLYSRFGKPNICTVCGTVESNNYDYANLSGNYHDLNDYAAMCRSCHWKYDGKVNNILKGKEGCHA